MFPSHLHSNCFPVPFFTSLGWGHCQRIAIDSTGRIREPRTPLKAAARTWSQVGIKSRTDFPRTR